MNKLKKLIILLKGGARQYHHGLFVGLCLLLTAGIGYNIGQIWASHFPSTATAQEASMSDLSNGSKSANKGSKTPAKTTIAPTPVDPRVVASKASDSKLYHHPWCSGAKRIKETNKLWFANESEAIQTGYTLAANCQ